MKVYCRDICVQKEHFTVTQVNVYFVDISYFCIRNQILKTPT